MASQNLTPPEVAEIVRARPETLRAWRAAGTGPAFFKIGRRVLYDANEVQRFIESAREHQGVA